MKADRGSDPRAHMFRPLGSGRADFSYRFSLLFFPIDLLHLSHFRRRADRLRLHPRYTALPPDNDNLPGEFRRQPFNVLLNPERQVHAVPSQWRAGVCARSCMRSTKCSCESHPHSVSRPYSGHDLMLGEARWSDLFDQS